MKKIGLFILLTLIITSCNQQPKPNETMTMHETKDACCVDSVKDGVFIHISQGYKDPHRVLMPLKMAAMMAMDKDVLVYMDISAVELAVKSAKDMNYADFESFQTYIKKLNEMNVGVFVCPTCLKVAGFKAEDLMDGIKIAEKDKFFNFTKGRIITLDY